MALPPAASDGEPMQPHTADHIRAMHLLVVVRGVHPFFPESALVHACVGEFVLWVGVHVFSALACMTIQAGHTHPHPHSEAALRAGHVPLSSPSMPSTHPSPCVHAGLCERVCVVTLRYHMDGERELRFVSSKTSFPTCPRLHLPRRLCNPPALHPFLPTRPLSCNVMFHRFEACGVTGLQPCSMHSQTRTANQKRLRVCQHTHFAALTFAPLCSDCRIRDAAALLLVTASSTQAFLQISVHLRMVLVLSCLPLITCTHSHTLTFTHTHTHTHTHHTRTRTTCTMHDSRAQPARH
jgi:hypothetical protein